MTRVIDANYDQPYIFPPSIEQWVQSDHPARFIRNAVDNLDLDQFGFQQPKSLAGESGRPHFALTLMIKAFLYGYFHKIRSFRALEAATHNDLGMIWLLGNNRIDHNTFWKFQKDHRAALKALFKFTVAMAADLGMVGLALQAVDGTKIRADVSKDRAWHRDDLTKHLARLEATAEEMMREFEANAEDPSYRLPDDVREKLEQNQGIIAEIQQKLAALEALGKKHHSPTDPDSNLIKSRDGGIQFNHNAQAVADEKHGIVVACDVTNEETDKTQLTPMIDEAVNNQGRAADTTTADAGYFSGQQLQQAEEKEYSVLVNDDELKAGETRGNTFGHSDFIRDEENDTYTCPAGKTLDFTYQTPSRDGSFQYRVYQCRSCEGCPLREQCTTARQGRRLRQHPHREAMDKNAERIEENGELLDKRKQIIEPVFGNIKHNQGFRRWSFRGLEKVKTQWALVCAAVNLRKIYNYMKTKGFLDNPIDAGFFPAGVVS